MITTTGNALSFPIVESVRERDIDLLILEELYADPFFGSIFLKIIGKEECIFTSAHRSISIAGLGETDILIEYKSTKGKVFIFLENKIDAEFQDAQYERYQKRADLLKNTETETFVILVAPQGYISNKSEFEYSISYEQLVEWFKTKDDARSKYKQEILRLAIEQERRGYQVIKDTVVTDFWKSYYSYIQTNLSELNMADPKSKPTMSSFVYLHPDWLPKDTRLIHKMEKGCLDFELSGKADEYDNIVEIYTSKLSDGIEIVVTGKSISFRVEVPNLSFKESFEDQIEKMQEFAKAYSSIKSWSTINIQ